MINSLLIGKAITAMLTANEILVSLVGNKIFPCVAQYDQGFPIVTYQRTGISPSYCKDGVAGDEVTADIYCISQSYAESLTIANAIREAVELVRGAHGGLFIRMATLTNATESATIDGNFQQRLTFKFIL